MKQRLLFLLAFCLGISFHAFAQFTPQGFNYQSVVRGADGTALSNQTVSLLFTIRSGAPNGPIAYAEKQIVSTNEFGLINLTIGQGGQPQLGDFATINWGGGAKFLTVAIETSPGAFDDLGATQLMSVPYALYAQTAANGGGGGGGDNWGSQTVQTSPVLSGNGTAGNPLSLAQQGAQPGQTLKWDGSQWTPSNDLNDNGFNGTVTQINTGAGLSGGPITTSGTIQLSPSGVTPGIYGSATQIPVIQIDANGRVTDVFTVVPQPGTVNIDGGFGINVQQNGFNFVITNTGDTNAGDDLTFSSTASGDVSGTFSNLQINASAVGSAEIANNSVGNLDLADNAVSTSKIADDAVTAAKLADMGASSGQVLKWNGASWSPAVDAQGITSIGITAGNGINVTGSSPNFTISNSGDTNAADDITTSTQANGDVTGPFNNLQIAAGVVGTAEIANGGVATADLADGAVTNPKIGDNAVTTSKIANGAVTAAKIDNMNATNGQVIKWNGTTWAPAADAQGVTNIVQGNGIDVDVVNGVYTITNIGDTDGSNDITIFSQADGDISGPFNNLQIKNGTVGNFEIMLNGVATNNIAPGAVTGAKIAQMGATSGQVLKWNGTTWAPAADQSGGSGDNWGTQVVVANGTLSGTGITGNALGIAQQGATNGQVLKWNGTTWAPAADNNTGADNWGTQFVQTNTTLSGTGVAGNVLGLAQQGATNGQVMTWNGSSWGPDDVPGDDWGAQTAKTGLTLVGNGTLGSPLNLAQQGATAGQVLKWSGAAWLPANDNTGGGGGSGDNYAAGVGIDITGSSPNFVINNTGDLDETNELQTLSLAGNVLTLSDGGGSVNLPAGNNYTAGTGISITGTAPNFVINNTGDADNDPDNELQTLSLNGTKLKISQTNTEVNLDTILANGGLNLWAASGANISNTNSANVGVGTNAPAAKLHVKGGSNEIVRVEGTNPLIGLSNGAGAPDAFLQHNANGFLLGTNDASNITIKSGSAAGFILSGVNGHASIGGAPTNSQLTLYHDKGGITLQNALSGENWTISVNENDATLQLFNSANGGDPVGTFAVNGVYTASDRRLKRDVLGLDKVLDKMMLLQPVTYHYRHDAAQQARSIGFLAQDVQTLFPELVGSASNQEGTEQYLALNYAGFSVLTVKAIQEQQAQIEQLKLENATLRQRTDSLESRLEKLEQGLKKD